MYTKEYDPQNDYWEILDPDGIFVCPVKFEFQADALLSHLNKG